MTLLHPEIELCFFEQHRKRTHDEEVVSGELGESGEEDLEGSKVVSSGLKRVLKRENLRRAQRNLVVVCVVVSLNSGVAESDTSGRLKVDDIGRLGPGVVVVVKLRCVGGVHVERA